MAAEVTANEEANKRVRAAAKEQVHRLKGQPPRLQKQCIGSTEALSASERPGNKFTGEVQALEAEVVMMAA